MLQTGKGQKKHCSEIASGLLTILVERMMEDHNSDYRYTGDFIDNLSPLLWWQSMPSLTAPPNKIIMRYMTAISSSASVKRVFFIRPGVIYF